MDVNRVEARRFLVIFLISLMMIYVSWLLNLIFKTLEINALKEVKLLLFAIQVFSFISGGAIIAWTKWQGAEWYMFFSFIIVGVVYLVYFPFSNHADIESLTIFALMATELTVGLFIATISSWLVKKGYVHRLI